MDFKIRPEVEKRRARLKEICKIKDRNKAVDKMLDENLVCSRAEGKRIYFGLKDSMSKRLK